jgi:4-hydroxybenzoate polyprenyltransferase
LAAGRVSPALAAALGVVLAAAGLGIGYWVSRPAFFMMLAYGLMNVLYTFYLKNVVLVDVFVIAAGFMLRILVGTLGVSIPPSQWLVLCGIMITLFLGFSKRRAEIATMGENNHSHRHVLKHYSPAFLDQMINITASGAIMSYGLYTMSPDTVRVHGTENLIYTVPIVTFGIFRYIYLLHHHHGGTDAAHEVVRDRWLALTVVVWLATTAGFIR